MKNQKTIMHNGTYRSISAFNFDGTVASGYVSGQYMEIPVGDYRYNYKRPSRFTPEGNAMHYLVHVHDAIYGYTPLPAAERFKCRRNDVTNSHIEYLDDGTSRLTCVVDGEKVVIDYKGTVTNDNGEVLAAKPFLGDAREDARRKARRKRPQMQYQPLGKVDDAFKRRLVDEAHIAVKENCALIGDRRIELVGDVRELMVEIEYAMKAYREEEAVLKAEIDNFFAILVA